MDFFLVHALMKPTQTPHIEICCIWSLEEAWLAIEQGASALTLVSEMPSGLSVIAEPRIPGIAVEVLPSIVTFFLTSKLNSDSIMAQQQEGLFELAFPGSTRSSSQEAFDEPATICKARSGFAVIVPLCGSLLLRKRASSEESEDHRSQGHDGAGPDC